MKRIAIIGDLPLWDASDNPIPHSNAWHYCVWLSALTAALSLQKIFEVHWIIPNKEVSKRKIVEARNQTFHLLPKCRLTVGQYTGYLYDSFIVQKELASIRPDLVHSWGTENSFSLAASYFQGLKLISIQGLLKAYSARARLALFERTQALYEHLTIKRFQYITTESPWAAEEVQRILPTAKPFHLEYSVEERFFSATRSLTSVPTCLYAGTNAPVKNLPTLIKVFSDPALAHIELLMAGITKTEFPDLPSNIRPLGRLNRDALVQQLSQTWALVHPSLADTGPTIAKEARVMGLPVMLTTDCGSKQHVVEGKSGFVVKPNDISAMKESILRMTVSSETALAMGKYGQDDCRKKLCADTMIDTLLGIYEKILS